LKKMLKGKIIYKKIEWPWIATVVYIRILIYTRSLVTDRIKKN